MDVEAEDHLVTLGIEAREASGAVTGFVGLAEHLPRRRMLLEPPRINRDTSERLIPVQGQNLRSVGRCELPFRSRAARSMQPEELVNPLGRPPSHAGDVCHRVTTIRQAQDFLHSKDRACAIEGYSLLVFNDPRCAFRDHFVDSFVRGHAFV